MEREQVESLGRKSRAIIGVPFALGPGERPFGAICIDFDQPLDHARAAVEEAVAYIVKDRASYVGALWKLRYG
jgi:hypothetical protein